MKHFVLYIVSILAYFWGVVSRVLNSGYQKYIFALIRGGKIIANAQHAGQYITLGKNTKFAGLKYMSIGDKTSIGDYCIITAYYALDRVPKSIIANHCNIGPFNHITCINEVVIGDGLLTGRWVTITDNSHGNNTIEEIYLPPWKRQLSSKGSVKIGKNVWIGDKATILPGVIIGDGVIIGANSVVTKNVPSNCIVCGNPAKIVKLIN